jgi:rhomboid protease GluP
MIILAINFAFFLVQLGLSHSLTNPDLNVGVALGVAISDYAFHGQWWRLITAGFLHGGWLHILMNSWSLFILVTEVEQFYGTSRLLVAYIFSTFTGFLLACDRTPHIPILGASCAAFGLMGIMLAMGIGKRADPLTQAVRQHYGQWLIFGLVLSLGGGISLWGHIGGLIGGFLVGLAAGHPARPGSPREVFWKVAAVGSVAFVFLCWYLDFAFISQLLKHSSGSM